MAQIDCHPLRQIFCLDDYLPLASGVTSITCNKWITFMFTSMPNQIKLYTWPDESQFRITDLLAFICIWLPTPRPCLSPDCGSKIKRCTESGSGSKKIELTLMNLNILLLGWNLPVRLNRQGLVRIHCRLALGSQTSNCPSCVCKAKRNPMHFFVLPKNMYTEDD